MGYIVLDRKLFSHWIWDKYGKEWVDLIQLANFEDKQRLYGNEVKVSKRGMVETTVSRLSARWGWSWHKTDDFINLLKQQEMITVEKSNKTLFIEITNYDKYQFNPQKNAIKMRQKCDAGSVEKYGFEEGAQKKQCDKNATKPRTKSEQKANIPIKEKKENKEINNNARTHAREGNSETDWFFVQASPELSEAVNRWVAYKAERRQSYKPIGLNTLLKKISEKAKTHGDAAVIEAIDEAIASQYQGIVWDRIRKPKNDFDMIRGWANE